jgi:LPS sulfotransferase NodH
MSARVGSTALLSALQVAGLSDHEIREIFNNRGYTAHFVERLAVETLCQYLNAYARRSGRRRLPFKIGWWDMAPLLKLLGNEFDAWFPNASWVYLQRRDRVAQAYSLWKGMNHNVWHVNDGERYRCPVDGEIPLDEIRELVSLIEAENNGWQTFFTEAGIEPVRIYYEDFAADPKSVTEMAYCGFTGRAMTGRFECPIIKSSDETDRRNVERLHLKLAV